MHNDAMEGDGDEEGGDVFLGRSATDAASAVLRRCLLQVLELEKHPLTFAFPLPSIPFYLILHR